MSSSESPAYRHASGTSNDLSTGIFETIDMGSYRVEKREVMKIALVDYDGARDPIPTSAPGHAAEPKLGRLSNIVRASAGRPQAILLRSGAMRPARFWSSTRQHAATEDCVRASS